MSIISYLRSLIFGDPEWSIEAQLQNSGVRTTYNTSQKCYEVRIYRLNEDRQALFTPRLKYIEKDKETAIKLHYSAVFELLQMETGRNDPYNPFIPSDEQKL